MSYSGAPAVRDLSLAVNDGEIVGLIGPNGAGKTTTLKCIFGLVPAARGEIAYGGDHLLGLAPEQIVRRGLALVPEGRQIFTTLSVRENLLLGRLGARAGTEDGDVDRVLDRFPVLRHYYRASAASLSGGEQQQLAIARALLARPTLLLLDEPSLGLAPLIVDELFGILGDLRDQGVTILLVEQNAARTVALADRTYVLRGGELLAHGTRAELGSLEDVSDMYFGAET